jgi:hypothetical protein
MIRNLALNRILWLITAALSLIVSVIGVLFQNIYKGVVDFGVMPGVFGQDLITIIASVLILVLVMLSKQGSYRKTLIILGLTGYLFYAYALYAIQGVLSVLYVLYLVICGLAFWSIICSLTNINYEKGSDIGLSNSLRYISAFVAILTAIVFAVMWIIMIITFFLTRDNTGMLIAVFVLDICFVLPSFAILGIMLLKKRDTGLWLMPSMFVFGVVLMLSLVVSELVEPLYNICPDIAGTLPTILLAVIYLILSVFYLRKIRL